MNRVLWLRCAFCLFCILASQNPLFFAVKLSGLQEFSRTYTKYGKLPEIQIPIVVYLAHALAVVLLMAVVLEFLSFKMAAPMALVCTFILWINYLPGIWYALSGDYRLEAVFGTTTPITWQILLFQTGAMACSGVLTYVRFHQMCLKSRN